MSDGLDEVLGYPTDNKSFRKDEFFKRNKFLVSFFKLLVSFFKYSNIF